MIQVTKDEAMTIRRMFRDAHVVSTNKRNSKAKNYFVEETTIVKRLLSRLRGNSVEHYESKEAQ